MTSGCTRKPPVQTRCRSRGNKPPSSQRPPPGHSVALPRRAGAGYGRPTRSTTRSWTAGRSWASAGMTSPVGGPARDYCTAKGPLEAGAGHWAPLTPGRIANFAAGIGKGEPPWNAAPSPAHRTHESNPPNGTLMRLMRENAAHCRKSGLWRFTLMRLGYADGGSPSEPAASEARHTWVGCLPGPRTADPARLVLRAFPYRPRHGYPRCRPRRPALLPRGNYRPGFR